MTSQEQSGQHRGATVQWVPAEIVELGTGDREAPRAEGAGHCE